MCLKYIRVFSNIFLLNTVWKNIGIRWEGTENQLVLKIQFFQQINLTVRSQSRL